MIKVIGIVFACFLAFTFVYVNMAENTEADVSNNLKYNIISMKHEIDKTEKAVNRLQKKVDKIEKEY